MGVSLWLSKVSLIMAFCAVRKEPHFPRGSPRTCTEIVTYWSFSCCVLDPTQACECLFIWLCHALCLSRLGALHHSSSTPQPDPQCPELYKHSQEGMLFMSHTELALCPGQCITNFFKEKATEQNPVSFTQGPSPLSVLQPRRLCWGCSLLLTELSVSDGMEKASLHRAVTAGAQPQ